VLTPTRFADISSELAADCGLTCKIIGPEQMKELGMELILAVSKGSVEEPRLIMLEYCGDPKNKKTIGLLGKGITFDAGGINLKQGNTMFNMKRDMTGGAIVIGIMKVLASLKPKLNCVAVVPASENMPQGNACKPGDIYRSLSGKWVEIINTDAEGRLVMADAMTYMQQQYHISTLIDVATLTVTARQSIGTSLISVFSNNDTLFEEMKWSGLLAGEELWRFPLYQKYKKGIRSYFSDLKNSTFTPPSSIKAALFLEDFLEKGVEWMHMDIATVDHSNKDLGVNSRGATVTGMRSLTNYLLMKGKVLNA
jgi:leucyl aminopeptidase